MTFIELRQIVEKKICVTLTNDQEERLIRFLALLQEWNGYFNLTAITEEGQIVEKHFLDSLLPTKYINLSKKTIIDIGTGAGFPGIVIAIVFPEVDVTLLESNNKKVRFLNAVVTALELKNVQVVCGRAEEQPTLRERFDYVIARAVKPLNILLELCIPFCKVGGCFIAMKSHGVEEEIVAAQKAMASLKCTIKERHIDYLPTENDERINLIIVKNDKTPLHYPRQFNQISAKPL